MKNRYCLFCGTLLPEDGVCLRCGAKYELADDGQLKVIPRKVKKISVRPSLKRKIAVKKADPSVAETQTIPIPEDIFSFSDDGKKEEKHADWTGEPTNNESYYVPNFVIQNEEHNKQNTEKTTINGEQTEADFSSESKTGKNKSTSWGKRVIALFVIVSLLSGIATYMILNAVIGPKQKSSKTAEEATSSNALHVNGEGLALYAEVLNAYKEYERNGYKTTENTYVDKALNYGDAQDERFYSDSCWIRPIEKLAYSFWDINNDGVDELFIGRTDDFGDYFAVIDVFTYTDKPSRVLPDCGFVGPGGGVHFYEDGTIAETDEQQDGPSDKRVKEQAYWFYELEPGAGVAKQTKSYRIETIFDSFNNKETLKAYKTESEVETEISLEEYGIIDDLYGGSWLEELPEYSAKWDDNNAVLKEKDFSWDYLIEDAAVSKLSEENKRAVWAYKQFVYGLYYELDSGYGSECAELSDMKAYLAEILNWVDEDDAFANDLEFAICDVNKDGILDFALSSKIGATASHTSVLYNYSGKGNAIVNVLEGYALEYYSNGDVAVLRGHNHTRGDLWPRIYYHQTQPRKEYSNYGEVYSWDRNLVDEEYPTSSDINGNGIVYTFDMEKTWVDDDAYKAWLKEHSVENPKEFEWHTFTENNVKQFEAIAAKTQ